MMLESLIGLRRRWLAFSASMWDRRQKRYAVTGRNTRVLLSGRISNSREPQYVTLGEGCWVAGELLVYPQGGRIDIGDYCYVGEGTRIWSAAHVSVGHRVFIAHGVNIHDNDAHSVSAKERHRHFRELVVDGEASFTESVASADVHIGDDAWIGFNSSILKGVRIGEGAIVGACSVVTRDVDPFTIVAGNPAAEIGKSLP